MTAPLHLALALFRDARRRAGRGDRRAHARRDGDGGLHDASRAGSFATRPRATGSCRTSRSCSRPTRSCCGSMRKRRRRSTATSIAIARRRSRVHHGRLAGAAGGYRGSEADRMRLRRHERRRRAPRCSAASTALDDTDARPRRARTARACPAASYRPGRGIAHCTDGASRVPGLLADHVAMIHALLDAHEVSDAEPYKMMAAGAGALRASAMWDERSGGFFDRRTSRPKLGLLRSRRKPFAVNCEAARALAPAGAAIIVRRGLSHVVRNDGRAAVAPLAAPGTAGRALRARAARAVGQVIHCRILRGHSCPLHRLTPFATSPPAPDRFVRSTSQAGSGHPTSCMSAADIVAALFFGEMRYDPQTRRTPTTIGSCLSKGTPRRFSMPPGPKPGCSRATSC